MTALIVELDWLSENRVIENLTERDIHGICKVAHQGTAGFNSRIVYGAGAWTPYRETENPAQLVKLADCGGFSITELPGETAQSTPTESTTHAPAPAPDRTPTSPAVPAFTAFTAIAGVLTVTRMRVRR